MTLHLLLTAVDHLCSALDSLDETIKEMEAGTAPDEWVEDWENAVLEAAMRVREVRRA